MKAFNVFPGEDPMDEGCVLVFALNRNSARVLALHYGPWPGFEYIDFKARRVPEFDEYYKKNQRPIIETNDELPKDAPKFFTEFY